MNEPDIQVVRRAWAACSWGNTTETAEEWLAILRGPDEERKRRLFKKLFLESPDGTPIRELFDKDMIRSYLETFDKPLSRTYSERRRKVWRYLYCGIRERIPELDWVIGK